MRNANIREVTGSTLKSWYEELKDTEDEGGCFSIGALANKEDATWLFNREVQKLTREWELTLDT